MNGRELWNRYSDYFNAEENQVFPPDHREVAFYRRLRERYKGCCLEIGAGSGRLARALLQEGGTIALEPSDSMIRAWSPGDSALAARVQGAGETLPFRNGVFDLVCFPYNGLQCVLDRGSRLEVVMEAFRVTGPGGCFAVEVSPVFGRREEEPLTERYRAVLHDGRELILNEKVERCSSSGNIRYRMFYTVLDGDSRSCEEVVLELASISAEEVSGMFEQAGFSRVFRHGDYDLSGYDPEMSPRLIVLAEKGV